MNIVCISRGNDSKGKELAKVLAAKLGYQCVSREDLVEEAIRAGIAVGKLEMAMLKPHHFGERLVLEKEHYQAFATMKLCERTLAQDVVYHGRTGHLLLPGASHVLRIRVVENLESRIDAAMARLNVSRDKARRYVESVDEDIHKWVRTLYGVDWDATSHYDLTLNLDQMTVPNAAAALCPMVALPEFQVNPAARQALENLYLAAKIRVALAAAEATARAPFRVTADRGVVSVSYQPQDANVAEAVPGLVCSIEGVREVHCTMASTNILWIQERYDPDQAACGQVVELAKRWHAAVELLRFVPGDGADAATAIPAPARAPIQIRSARHNGGIEDDVDEPEGDADDGGLRKTQGFLSREGVGGGTAAICGPTNRLLDGVNTRVKYFLVVVGDLFIDKGHAAQVRLTRELAGALSETLKTPVIGADELKKAYLFGPRQWIEMFGYLGLSAAVLALILVNQGPVLRFAHAEGLSAKAVGAVGVTVLASVFAFLYGTFARNVLKLLKIE